jgi:RNA polymerase sigma factor (sigma-70 family)
MPTAQLSGALGHLRRAALLCEGGPLTDAQLLESFLTRRDEAAFAALVRRHGSMVLNVCRRVLRNAHDAEDAFQATFLVLVRKAPAIAQRELLANWLYGVARRTAREAKAATTRRRLRERQLSALPETAAPAAEGWLDLRSVLDQELHRLPDRLRVPVVLCDLEGRTRRSAARQLGIPVGTLSGRLTRARQLLARRLTRRGLALSGGALSAALATNGAAACVPAPLLLSTTRAALLLATGDATATSAVSTTVAALTERMMTLMFLARLRSAAVLVLLLTAVCLGGGLLALPAPVAGQSEAGKASLRSTGLTAAPQMTGPWHSDDWGTVKLRPAGKGAHEGTYSGTFGKALGRIRVSWSAASGHYEGTWGEGTYRFGRLSFRVAEDGKSVRGAYSADPRCEYRPASIPNPAELHWQRGEGPARHPEVIELERLGAVPLGPRGLPYGPASVVDGPPR